MVVGRGMSLASFIYFILNWQNNKTNLSADRAGIRRPISLTFGIILIISFKLGFLKFFLRLAALPLLYVVHLMTNVLHVMTFDRGNCISAYLFVLDIAISSQMGLIYKAHFIGVKFIAP